MDTFCKHTQSKIEAYVGFAYGQYNVHYVCENCADFLLDKYADRMGKHDSINTSFPEDLPKVLESAL